MRAVRSGLMLVAVAATSHASAQPLVIADSGDTGWVIAASLLLLIAALPGLVLINGARRQDHVGLAVAAGSAIASLLFVAVGYSLIFSEGSAMLGGTTNAFLADLADLQPDMTIPGAVFVLFELCAAVFAVAILVASIAGRARMGWMLTFAGLWLLIVYVPVARAVWGGGWLGELGALDYAGGIVLQTTAGISALVVALLMGRDREESAVERPGIAIGGLGVLWIGWLALIGGSGFAATGDAGAAMINAHLAASSALITGLLIERLRDRATSSQKAVISTIAGLAAISAGAGFVSPGSAMIIGAVGAVGAAIAGSMVRRLGLGSAAQASVAHAGGAIPGAIFLPVFVLPILGGPGFEDGLTVGRQVATQAIAVVAVGLWAAVATSIIALMLSTVLPIVDDRTAP